MRKTSYAAYFVETLMHLFQDSLMHWKFKRTAFN